MKYLLLFIGMFLFTGCSGLSNNTQESELNKYLSEISIENMKNHVYNLASDEMNGRKTGEEGQKIAAEYLRDFYSTHHIEAANQTENYYQFVPGSYMSSNWYTLSDSENVVAFIEGSDLADEFIVISAHYDHMGVENGQIMYGADDNGSGTAALMEMARVFQKAKEQGQGARRSIVFLHCTGEEFGLHGSRYYTENPLYPLDKTIANINIDMIGRSDDNYLNKESYVYVIGPSRLSNDLNQLIQTTNEQVDQLTLDYTYDAADHPEMLFYRSDHYNFAVKGIPVAFFFGGVHPDYHQPTDTADKILYDEMLKRTRLIFASIWQIANRKQPIIVN